MCEAKNHFAKHSKFYQMKITKLLHVSKYDRESTPKVYASIYYMQVTLSTGEPQRIQIGTETFYNLLHKYLENFKDLGLEKRDNETQQLYEYIEI
jgi:hypothetical protein